VKHFVRIVRVAPKDDVLILLSCFSLTVFFDMTVAVAVGMGLAAMLFIRRSTKLVEAEDLTKEEEYELPECVSLFKMNGPLFFGSAQQAIKNIANIITDVRVVILDMSDVTLMDMTALVAMESIVDNLADKKIALVINDLQPRMILKMRRVGIRKVKGELEFSRSLDEALQHAEAMRH